MRSVQGLMLLISFVLPAAGMLHEFAQSHSWPQKVATDSSNAFAVDLLVAGGILIGMMGGLIAGGLWLPVYLWFGARLRNLAEIRRGERLWFGGGTIMAVGTLAHTFGHEAALFSFLVIVLGTYLGFLGAACTFLRAPVGQANRSQWSNILGWGLSGIWFALLTPFALGAIMYVLGMG